jgi:HPt (histidine-containing phosphotransfer) domain-containing protein
MSVSPDELQAKVAVIAGRFLDRVTREIEQLETMVDSAASGDLAIVKEIEALTHRMHGSGAMLQFEEISGPAGELERMSAEFVSTGQVDQPRMLPVLQRLQTAIAKACANRAAAVSAAVIQTRTTR